ncbi:MAG: tyrosine-protein phosphatase [Bacteroidales bacterium]|nr:tyrosine-protein phosphatase [Bacteroidales bacterium]
MRINRIIALLLVSLFCACEEPTPDNPTPPPPAPVDNPTDPTGPTDPTDPTDPLAPEYPEGDYIIVGYATYWDTPMPDPSLLTHINYSFAHIKSDFESLDIKSESRLKKIAGLKKGNPSLKVLLSVGGWEAGNFSEMAADPKHRQAFCDNCLAAVNKYELDGIDLDWEYPTSSAAGISSSPDDTKNFNYLLSDLRKTLGDGKLITMASSANAKYVDFKTATQYLDYVNIMTYDMGKPPYHNAGLYKSGKTQRSCDESVQAHFNAGVPYEKIVLGIPFYGHGNGAEFSTDCVDFNEIKFDGFNRCWDEEAQVPYLTNAFGNMVLSYDDEVSVGLKAEYVKQKGLRGAMYWNIEADDSNWTLSKAIATRLLPASVPENQESAFLVTNEYVQRYLEEVEYTDTDYETTQILGYPGGGPGTADVPPSFTIKWPAASGSQILHLWNGNWARDYTVPAGTSTQDVSNLVPNTTYYYTVTTADDHRMVASGSFATRGLLHQVYFEPNGRNGRDLGGWKGLNGKTVAYRKLYRGGAIHGSRTNSKGKQDMLAEGIRAEVDLREEDDVPSKSPLGSNIAFFAPGFDSGYNTMVRDNKPKVKDTFMFVVQCLRENKPVYFHCAAGRDRTGTLAILLLGALGVSESDMAKDYELTYFSPADWSMSEDDNGNPVYKHTRNNYSYPSVRKTIFAETGSGTYQERIVAYLLNIGVPQQDIDDLREIMLK